jgi:predicted transcriptional regulator
MNLPPEMERSRMMNAVDKHENTCYTIIRGAQMEKQNITLSLSKDVLRRVKVLAAEQDTSVTAIMEKLLSDYATHHEGYRQARQDHLSILRSGLDLGTGGMPGWTREELHER